jgi:hypothetical protein
MATNLSEIERFLKEEGLRYTRMDEYIRTSFGTDDYEDSDGDKSVFLILKPEESGEYFKLIAPNLYKLPAGPDRAAVFQTLLMISWRTKLVQFEYDDSDGEIRGIVEFPLEDAELTRRQLMRCVHGIVQIVDEYHGAIDRAIRTGRVSLDAQAENAALDRLASEYYSYLGVRRRGTGEKLRLEE